MVRRPFLVILWLFSVCAQAAEVRLGSEIALSPLGAPRLSRGSRPRLASNGRDFVALWRDESSITYAMAYDANGNPKTQYATRVSTRIRSLEVASDGTDYLVIWSDSLWLYAQHLDENGVPRGAPRQIAGRLSQKATVAISAASNGTSYLVSGEGSGTQLLDRTGETIRSLAFTNVVWIGTRGSDYQVIERRDVCTATCATRFELSTVTESGSITTTTLADTDGRGFLASAAASDDAIIVVDVRNVRVFGRDGALRGALTLPFPFSPAKIFPAWDGQNFVTFLTGNDGVYVLRVTRQGTLVDAKPFPRRVDLFDDTVRMASNGSRELVLWREGGIVGRAVFSFDEIDASQPDVFSVAPDAKIAPQLAASGANEIVAWIDQRTAVIEGRANGHAFTITPVLPLAGKPAVVVGDDGFLVSWFERGAVWGHQLIASRVTFDGQVIDRTVVRTLWQDYSQVRPAVAYGGGAYLFAIHDRGEFTGSLHFVRLPRTNAIEHVRTIEESAPKADILTPRVVWNGSEFVAAYVTFDNVIARLNFVRAVAGDAATVFEFNSEYPGAFGFAHGAGHATAVVPHAGLSIVQREGATSSIGAFHPTNVELIWNGAEYVLAWTETTDSDYRVRALRLNASGRALDEQPIEIGAAASIRSPSLAATAEGVKIAYDRVDFDNHDAVRVFARTLERQKSTRTRAVR